jgi:hypothetical protein
MYSLAYGNILPYNVRESAFSCMEHNRLEMVIVRGQVVAWRRIWALRDLFPVRLLPLALSETSSWPHTPLTLLFSFFVSYYFRSGSVEWACGVTQIADDS